MFFFEYGDGDGVNACYVTGWYKIKTSGCYRLYMVDGSDHVLEPEEFASFRDQLKPMLLDSYKPDVVA